MVVREGTAKAPCDLESTEGGHEEDAGLFYRTDPDHAGLLQGDTSQEIPLIMKVHLDLQSDRNAWRRTSRPAMVRGRGEEDQDCQH